MTIFINKVAGHKSIPTCGHLTYERALQSVGKDTHLVRGTRTPGYLGKNKGY